MPTYKTIHTAVGLQLLAEAESSGMPINLTEMAVGDGNGNAVDPAEGMTALVREMYRGTINRVYKPDPSGDPMLFAAELVVPASEGGFVMREVAAFTADGDMFVIGNLPDTYKPNTSEGSYSDTLVRIYFKVTNADTVTIIADPNVVVVTQQWISNNVTACTILPGGTTGQILQKASNACGDVQWVDATEANVVVDIIEEKQTLAASQTTVVLASTTTRGLAVYIEGVRIGNEAGADGWQADVGDPDTTIVLGQSYPAGTVIRLVQNEPLGAAPFPLVRDQNLADLDNAATARTNLGVYSKAETDQKAPAGLLGFFARNTAPTGWLKANGAAVSRTTYVTLFTAIGTTFGAGDGFNTFNLPDLRGEFVRGWDDGRGVDAGRVFGSYQADALQNITGSFQSDPTGISATGAFQNEPETPSGGPAGSGDGTVITFDASRVARTASETRTRNRAMLACIKF